MSYNIKLLPIALSDLRKAKKWYQEINSDLALDFKVEINKELDYIRLNPTHYQKKHKHLRQSKVIRFPYCIFYLVHVKHKAVIVLGVLHTSRNPKIAKNRIKK